MTSCDVKGHRHGESHRALSEAGYGSGMDDEPWRSIDYRNVKVRKSRGEVGRFQERLTDCASPKVITSVRRRNDEDDDEREY